MSYTKSWVFEETSLVKLSSESRIHLDSSLSCLSLGTTLGSRVLRRDRLDLSEDERGISLLRHFLAVHALRHQLLFLIGTSQKNEV